MVEREVFTSSAFIRAVNQKLKPQYKIGPSNPSTDHPLDSHSLAFRAYKRARGLGKHLATLIENEHMKCSFVRGAFLEDDRLLLNQLAEGKVHPNSEELLKEALRENVHVVEDVGAVAAWLRLVFLALNPMPQHLPFKGPNFMLIHQIKAQNSISSKCSSLASKT